RSPLASTSPGKLFHALLLCRFLPTLLQSSLVLALARSLSCRSLTPPARTLYRYQTFPVTLSTSLLLLSGVWRDSLTSCRAAPSKVSRRLSCSIRLFISHPLSKNSRPSALSSPTSTLPSTSTPKNTRLCGRPRLRSCSG